MLNITWPKGVTYVTIKNLDFTLILGLAVHIRQLAQP